MISLFVVVVFASVFVSSMTNGALEPSLLRQDQKLLALMGLDQRWDIFAPDPRRKAVEVRAQITYADGQVEKWRLPNGPPVIGGYWDGRWRKWLDNAMRAGPQSELWPDLAKWLARERLESGRRPVHVTVVGRYHDQYRPGTDPLRGPWRELVVHRLPVSPFQAVSR